MKNFTSIIRITILPLVLGCIFSTLFSACNADRPDLPKEYNILRFKVDGEQVVNPTECGEWLNGCDPIEVIHDVSDGTIRFTGGDYRDIYIYIHKKWSLMENIMLDNNDRIVFKILGDDNYNNYTKILSYKYKYLERELEEGWIEGEFDFILANNEGDTVEITDGYFKLTIDVY
jgi:hypothetical protein